MALQKPMDFGNGVTTEEAYITVSSISIDYEKKSAFITVKTYLNKSVYDGGLLTIINPENFQVGNYTTLTVTESNNDLFDQYFLTGDTKTNTELYLKTLDKYKDCVIVA